MSKKKSISKNNIVTDVAQDQAKPGSKTLAQLSTKAIKVGIKSNMTAEMFAEEYGCTTDEFLSKVGNLFLGKNSYEEIIKGLKKNESYLKRSTSNRVSQRTQPKKATETTQERLKKAIEVELPKELDDLEKMKAEILTYDTEVVAEKQTFEKVRKELTKKMNNCESDIRELNRQLEEKKTELEEIKTAREKAGISMDQLLEVHKAAQTRLDLLKEAIEKALMPTVCIYNDGTIGIEEKGQNVDFEFEGADALATQLMGDEFFDAYKVIDIKIISKTLTVARHYQKKVSLLFDNPEIEKGYSYAIEKF